MSKHDMNDIKRLHPDTYITNASTPLERITHWMLAGSCIVLFITGIGSWAV